MAVQQDNLIQAIARLIVEEVPQIKVEYSKYGYIYFTMCGEYTCTICLEQDILVYQQYNYHGSFKLADPECFRQLGRAILENFEQFRVWRCNKII